MRIAEAGQGPLVVLAHGFPEGWYAWRHQLVSLAEAGFHAVAPDMRGYGGTEAPEAIEDYTIFHLVGDLVGLLDALREEQAVVVGHDWGANVAWHAALLRPDRFRAVASLSVPFRPRAPRQPTTVMPRTAESEFYQLYFQPPGRADAELGADPRATIRDTLLRLSGDVPAIPGSDGFSMVPLQGGLAARLGEHAAHPLPAWLTEADLDHYAEAFARAGFRGGLNWYRNLDRNWGLMRAFQGVQVQVPALFVTGDRDLDYAFPASRELIEGMRRWVPLARDPVVLPGCGHWTQQERAAEVNAALLEFLRSLQG